MDGERANASPIPVDQALSTDRKPSPDDEVTLAELADLRAGTLSADEETRLRMRMAGDPEVENKLWALDNVHRLFEKPTAQDELPDEMPYDVAARLQARIAEQALRRGPEAALDVRDADGQGGAVEIDTSDSVEIDGYRTLQP